MTGETDAWIHRRLLKESRALVQQLRARPVLDDEPMGLCWPDKPLRVEGRDLACVAVELSPDPKVRRELWMQAIFRLEPFCVLQSMGVKDGVEVIFESRLGAAAWLILPSKAIRELPQRRLGYLLPFGRA